MCFMLYALMAMLPYAFITCVMFLYVIDSFKEAKFFGFNKLYAKFENFVMVDTFILINP